jgi:DNA polymerase-3 subunit delta'
MQSDILGHEAIRERLERLLARDSLPHSLLFAGSSGVGKKKVAVELYTSLFCETPGQYGGCGTCKSCSLVAAHSMPNFTVVDCANKEESSVERIRALLYELHLKVSEGGAKVLILDNAEYLSEQAQNIFLKGLEEPRDNTYFCLITASLSRLLKTIQSRCQIWHFDTLNSDQIATILEQLYGSDPERSDSNWQELAQCADGSLNSVIQLMDESEHWQQAVQFISLLEKKNLHGALTLAQELKSKKETMRPLLAALRSLARNRMLAAESREQKFAWSVFLSNTLAAESLILERNLSIELVLSNIALSVLRPSKTLPFTSIGNDATVLRNYTV